MDKHMIQAAERVSEGSRSEAIRWLLAAAEQGLPRAQVKLAELYAGEPDVPGNSIKACGGSSWRRQACAAQISKVRKSAYQRASLCLTQAQIEKAKWFAQSRKPAQPPHAASSEPANSDGGRA